VTPAQVIAAFVLDPAFTQHILRARSLSGDAQTGGGAFLPAPSPTYSRAAK